MPSPQTPVRDLPAAPHAPLRPAQARDVRTTPLPQPVFVREDAPSPPSPEAKFILGIQVHRRENGGIFLSQRAYLEDVLLRLGHADGRTSPTPMQPNLQLAVASEDHQPTPAFRSRYLQAVGSLMYAMLGTRPDLCYAVGVLGRHAARPDASHWAAIVRVLQYIKGTLDMGRDFQPDDSPMPVLRRTPILTGMPAVSHRARLWATPLSSPPAPSPGRPSCSRASPPRQPEAEYLGLSHTSKEAIHLRSSSLSLRKAKNALWCCLGTIRVPTPSRATPSSTIGPATSASQSTFCLRAGPAGRPDCQVHLNGANGSRHHDQVVAGACLC